MMNFKKPRIELTQNSILKNILKSRYPQTAIVTFLLGGFLVAILTGLLGTPVGNRNFGIVFVWIVWWAVLILIAVPFFGRGWCGVCPIPMIGDWLQRGWIIQPVQRGLRSMNLRFPKRFRNMWLQNFAFILVALFSPVILTTPSVTSLVLMGMVIAAVGLSLVFERRAFCRYVCPVGGFIGVYSQASPLELRVKDKGYCAVCIEKPCYNGSEKGAACPWGVFPAGLTKNTYCGLCLECLRSCANDNLSLNLRGFSSDLNHPSARLDEAYKAFIMLGSVLAYAYVFMGTNGWVKNAAYQAFSLEWLLYVVAFLFITLLFLPGLYWLFNLPFSGIRPAGEGGKKKTIFSSVGKRLPKKAFSALSAPIIPLGLMGWIAFSLSFLFTNANYVLITLSDPLGFGWDLFGSASLPWKPYLSEWLPLLQVTMLAIGLAWSSRIARNIAPQQGVSPRGIFLYGFVITSLMLWVLL